MGRLIIIACIAYPLSIAATPEAMRLTASLCIVRSPTGEAIDQIVHDLDTQNTYESKSDASEHNGLIALKKCTFHSHDRYAEIEYLLPHHCAKTIKTLNLMFGMENIVAPYPADPAKYIRFSLVAIQKIIITPRTPKRVSFALLPVNNELLLAGQDDTQ